MVFSASSLLTSLLLGRLSAHAQSNLAFQEVVGVTLTGTGTTSPAEQQLDTKTFTVAANQVLKIESVSLTKHLVSTKKLGEKGNTTLTLVSSLPGNGFLLIDDVVYAANGSGLESVGSVDVGQTATSFVPTLPAWLPAGTHVVKLLYYHFPSTQSSGNIQVVVPLRATVSALKFAVVP